MNSVQNKEKPKSKFRMPSTATLLMLMILLAAIATYIVPAGEFQRVVI